MDNPIKYSEFIQPDQSVANLITQLEQLQSTYTDLESKIRKDAGKISDALKGVNSATETGRETTRKAATDTEKLGKAYTDLAKSQTDVAKELVELKLIQQKQNQVNKLTIKFNRAVEGSYEKLSAEYSLNKIKLNAMSKAQRESTTSGKKLEKQTKDIYTEMNRLQKATGKHTLQVGDYKLATENLHPALGRVNRVLGVMGTNLQTLSTADKPFKVLTAGALNFGKAAMAFVLSPIGLILGALAAVFYLIVRNKDTIIDFNSGLIDVGKTANLSGDELRDLGDDIINLSKKLKVIGVPALLQYAKVAGQLGVKGRANILAFTESLAKLETASDIAGEEGAANITRLLTLTDGGVQNVAAFGDEIVNLGNNFAATEREILGNATAIAQNTAQYGFGRRMVLAYATATKAVGLEAEITGSTLGRSLGLMEKSIRTGKGLSDLVKLTGLNVDELKTQFRETPSAVFTKFIDGLNGVNVAGGSVNEQLSKIGITSIRDQRVLSSLATKGFGILKGAIDEVGDAAGSLDIEFGAASKKLESQFSRVGIAWDNLMLRIDDGEGFLSKTAAFLAGQFADSIDRASFAIKVFGAAFKGLANVAGVAGQILMESLEPYSRIKIDLKNPINTILSFKDVLSGLGDIDIADNFKRLGGAFSDAFTSEIDRSLEATKEAVKKLAKGVDDELSDSVKKSILNIGDIDAKIADLNKTLKKSTDRAGAKVIQAEIKELVNKRNAILGIANANLKEIESRALGKQKAEISVMAEGEDKDIARLELDLVVKRKLWEKFGLDTALLETFKNEQLAEIRKKWSDKEIADKKKITDDQEKARKKVISDRNKEFSGGVRVIDQQFDLAMSEIDLLKTTEAEKTRLRLEAEKKRLLAILALNKKMGGNLSDLQIGQMENTIKKIDQETEKIGKDSKGDIYSKLGLSLDDEQKEAVKKGVQMVINGVKSIAAARVEAADAVLRKSQEETAEAQTKVDKEIEARNNGYANNVLSAQRELELKKKQEAAALKEKKKAQKAQAAIDTVTQTTGLLTASVQIWKSLAGIPVIGPALAVAAVGTMWGAYAANKIKAKQAAKQKFGDGGLEYLQGGSHASGNDIPIGTTSSGKQRTAEGGEAMAIINRKNTRKYRDSLPGIIKSLNNGTFENAYSNSFVDENNKLIFAQDNSDFSKMENSLEAIRQNGEKRTYLDGDGRLVEVYKNIKRIYV
jgi:TP901 family phage tail tape measure protein